MPAKFEFETYISDDGMPEHVLWCSLVEGDSKGKVIYFWANKPKQDEVLEIIKFALRCFDTYHASLSRSRHLAVFHSIEGLEPEPESNG